MERETRGFRDRERDEITKEEEEDDDDDGEETVRCMQMQKSQKEILECLRQEEIKTGLVLDEGETLC